MVTAPDAERVSHLWPNDCYFAHLAIYWFASQFCRDAVVLDAGSGTGYGSAYLADHGAKKVIGVDVDSESVQFSMEHFNRGNVEFLSMDLENLSGLDGLKFDLIFSSNTLEHIPNLERFFYSATNLLERSGQLIVAVPPIITVKDRDHNIANPYHLNIWSPFQWKHMLERYFDEVQAYRHDLTKIGYPLNFENTPPETEIDETDFGFSPVPLDDLVQNPSLTALFIARSPKSKEDRPTPRMPISFIDDSFSRGSIPNQHLNRLGRLYGIFKHKFRVLVKKRQR